MSVKIADRDNPFSPQALQIYTVTVFFYAIVYMVMMIIPFYGLSLGGSKTDIGLIMGATMFTSMLIRPVAGSIIDKYGAWRVFRIVLAVFAVSLFGYFVPDLWAVGLIRVVQGIVAAFFSTAMEIITIELMSERLRGQGLSLYSLATMIPSTFGPAAALYLKDSLTMHSLFVLLAAMGIANVVLALFVSRRGGSAGPAAKPHEAPPPREPGLWKNRSLIVSSVIMLLASIANGAIFTFLPLHLESMQSSLGSVYFLLQTVVLVLCRFVGRKRIPSDGSLPLKLVLAMSLLACAGSLLLSASVAWPVLIAAAVCNGVAFALLYPALLTFVSFSVPAHARGFLLGLFIGAADCGFSLGALAMGPLAEALSFQAMYVACAICCVVPCWLILFYRNKRARNKRGAIQTGV